MLNNHFREFIELLEKHGVDFVVVGGMLKRLDRIAPIGYSAGALVESSVAGDR